MTERWKPRSPHTLTEDLTFERPVIPRPVTGVMEEDICYPINTEIEALPANESNEVKNVKIRNSNV